MLEEPDYYTEDPFWEVKVSFRNLIEQLSSLGLTPWQYPFSGRRGEVNPA